MRHKQGLCVVLGAVLLGMTLFTGCSSMTKEIETSTIEPMKKEDSNAISFNIIGGKDVMPIGGYYGPHNTNWCWNGNQLPDLFTDEMFELYKDMGINWLSYVQLNNRQAPDEILKVLEQCDKFDMAYMPLNIDIMYNKGENALSVTQAGEQLALWSNHESWCGGYIVDEPSTSYYMAEFEDKYVESYKEIANVLNNELDIVSYGSLWPMEKMSNKKIYEQYVKEYCETFNPKFLMWDEYPFHRSYGGDMSTFITALSIISRNAKENSIPFWFFIAAGDQFGGGATKSITPYWPNEAQFNWSVNAGLTFGAQGISYYSLMEVHGDALTDEGGLDPYRSGLIGALGNKTMWYHYAKNINKHIAAIDHVLMNSVHKGVIVSGQEATSNAREASCILEGKSFRELQSVDGDAMVGCFNYNGKTALYVLNYSREFAQHITLNFDTQHNITITQAAENVYVKGNAVTLDMTAGEGVLLVIE